MRSSQALVTLVLFFSVTDTSAQKSYSVTSPSGELTAIITTRDTVKYSIQLKGSSVLNPSPVALLTNVGRLGIGTKATGTSTRQVRESISNPVPYKRREIPNHFNELTIRFREKFSLIFRAYDDGIAYRFSTSVSDSLTIQNELATFRFTENDTAYFPKIQQREGLDIFHTSFEEPYLKRALEDILATDIAFSPVLINGQLKTIITESDLADYPGMFLKGSNKTELSGIFAGYPDKEQVMGGEFKQPMVTSRKQYIAKTSGTRNFPWRVIIVAKTDADLLMNDIVYRLGKPPVGDWSWVKPGMSTEEWICGINLYDVDFKAGLNTASYKYYIDFASTVGMQYVMLDAGWSDTNDLFKITPEMDLQAIADYARSKNIGLIFWTLSMTLEKQLDRALEMFKSLNGKVVMTDFMDRDDQKMVNFYQRVAEAAARHQMMVMFHGAFKNAGFERTYPHAITREGVLGSEFNIWSEKVTPEHDLILPFTRMVAGPMDYEPGFMVNVNKQTFRPVADVLMSMGTRCHQLAMFVVYESPLQLFSGNPSDALKEEAYIKYLGSIPTTWDETVVLEARIGDYVLLARRKNEDWYLAGMTDWTGRVTEAKLSFLGAGKYRAEICQDGVNAEKHGSDYKMSSEEVNLNSTIKVKMVGGGGFVAKIFKVSDE
jgi:alpha-glucosidase